VLREPDQRLNQAARAVERSGLDNHFARRTPEGDGGAPDPYLEVFCSFQSNDAFRLRKRDLPLAGSVPPARGVANNDKMLTWQGKHAPNTSDAWRSASLHGLVLRAGLRLA
jgi:hypothetical protein